MKKMYLMKVLLLILTLNAQICFAENKCVHLFLEQSTTVAEDLKKISVTAGAVNVFNKSLPVVLVNKESVGELLDIYNKSIGIVVAHQKGYNNDHGLLRLGEYFVDRDSPGQRHRGEIHRTGISFASVADYTAYTCKSKGSYNRVEVLFKLSETEYRTAIVYQKMRRAGIIRPNFSFGGDTNPKDVNNQLRDCGEICFSFSTGSDARAQAQASERQIRHMGLENFGQLSKNDEFQNLYKSVDELLWFANLSGFELNPQMLSNLKLPKEILDLKLNETDQAELLRWIVGAKVSADYAVLLNDLKISNSSDYSNARSERASAVLVYDGSVTAENFATPQYVSEGIFSTWTNSGFVKIETAPKKNFFGLF